MRDDAFVSGILVTQNWDEVELAAGSYDFSDIDGWIDDLPAGQHVALRMLGMEPPHVVAAAATTWNWVDPVMRDECPPPDGCKRPVPWDDSALTAYEAMVAALAQASITTGGVTAPLAQHPALESVMLVLPGWSRIRELNFEIESLPGYDRTLLIDATRRALKAQVDGFPGKPVFVQFFLVDDGVQGPALWEALRDAITSDPELDAVGFYEENLAHSVDGGVDTFRPATEIAAPLFTAKDQTFTGFQALTSWAMPFAGMEDRVAGGSPPAAMNWALETYGSRYFELYAADIDAASDAHPEWLAAFEEVAGKLCTP